MRNPPGWLTLHAPIRAIFAAALVALWGCDPKPPQAGSGPRRENPAARFAIAWSVRLGGPGFDQLREVIVLKDGTLLVGGQASSEGLPTSTNAVQPRYAGEPPGRGHEGQTGGDCYLAKLDARDGRFLAGTYFGGSKQERNVYGMALDGAGNVVITSATRSSDIATTKGAAQRAYGGGRADWMVAKLAASLEKTLWCTYLGGPGEDFPRGGLFVDSDDSVVVLGVGETGFPTTDGAYAAPKSGGRDVYVARLRPDGGAVSACARIGGSGDDGVTGGALGPGGSVVVGGNTDSADFPSAKGALQERPAGKSDFFMARLNAKGSALDAATLLGSSEADYIEHRVRVLADGTCLVAGAGGAADFAAGKTLLHGPGGGADGIVAHLGGDGRALAWAARIGGSRGENLLMPSLGPDGNVWFCGFSGSADFPSTADAMQTYGGGPNDGVIGALSPDGKTLVFATLVGGDGDEIVRNFTFGPDGALYLVGSTMASDFPVTDASKAAGAFDAFVMKLVAKTSETGTSSRR